MGLVMAIKLPKQSKMPRIERVSQVGFTEGMVSVNGYFGVPRTGLMYARNCEFTKSGAVRSRGAFGESGIPDLPGTLQGHIFSFSTSSGNALLAVCKVGETCGLYRFEDNDAEWTDVSNSYTFQEGFCFYAQYGKLVAIVNGVDHLTWYDIEYGETSRPGAETTQEAVFSLSGGEAEPTNYVAYYVTSIVNAWGETQASSEQHAYIELADPNYPLGQWSTNITVSVPEIEGLDGAFRVRIYRCLSPDMAAPSITYYYLVKEMAYTGRTLTWVDDGTAQQVVVAPQLENSTGGLIAKYVTEIDGRLWCIGAGSDFQKIYYCGTAPTDTGYPSFFTGDGGYFYVAYGTSTTPVVIRRGRSDDGQICNFVLCSTPEGKGRRFNILPLSTTYGEQQVFQYYPEEQRGDEGAFSANGVVDYMNSILYPSQGGFKSTGVRATYTGNNITAVIDDKISDITGAINKDGLDNAIGVYFDGKAIWRVSPIQCLVFDVEDNGRWSLWDIPTDYIAVLSIGHNRNALYAVYNHRIYKYSPGEIIEDYAGANYPVVVDSGNVYASPQDGREWVRLLNVILAFSNLSGPVQLEIAINTRKGMIVYTGQFSDILGVSNISTRTGSPVIPISDMWYDKGDISDRAPISAAAKLQINKGTSTLTEVRTRMNKDVNFLRWRITSLEGFKSMQLETVTSEFVGIGVGMDFSSKYNEVRPEMTKE
jgi:hypothetical protein